MRSVEYPARARVLVGLIQRHGLKFGVELGVEAGETHIALLRECPDLTLVGVDTWKGTTKGVPRGPMKEDLAREVAKRFPGRSTLMRIRTTDAAHHFADGSVDLVFIDADHTYEAVRDDIMAWLPKVKPSGWVTGHDWDLPGVDQAIRELLPGHKRHAPPSKVWTIPRNEVP